MYVCVCLCLYAHMHTMLYVERSKDKYEDLVLAINTGAFRDGTHVFRFGHNHSYRLSHLMGGTISLNF